LYKYVYVYWYMYDINNGYDNLYGTLARPYATRAPHKQLTNRVNLSEQVSFKLCFE